VIFGFGRNQKKVEKETDEDQEEEFVLFQGAANGNNPDLTTHGRLVQAGLLPAKKLVSDALAVRGEMIRIDQKGQVAASTVFIDTVPTAPTKMPALQGQAIVQILKLLSGLDIKVKNRPQAGAIKAEYDGKVYELRVNTQPMEGGTERLTIRAIDPAVKLEKPRDLGFSEALIEKIRNYSAEKNGVILAAGPPFSGVTTLKLALMRCSDAYLYSIYFLANIGREISYVKMFETLEGDDLSKTMMRASREDADVLVIDPIDDPANAKAALEFSANCSIVSDLHAKDAAEAVARLIKAVGPQLVANQLKLVASQMFVRALCKTCRRAYRPNPTLLSKIGLPPETRVLYRPTIAGAEPEEGEKAGEESFCDHCNGIGYKGKIALLEIIEMTDGMKQTVQKGADPKAIRMQARIDKTQSFQSDGLRAVVEGNTSLEELQRAFKSQA